MTLNPKPQTLPGSLPGRQKLSRSAKGRKLQRFLGLRAQGLGFRVSDFVGICGSLGVWKFRVLGL